MYGQNSEWYNAGFSHVGLCWAVYSYVGLHRVCCWFSHDVTKIQTAKLSILLRFYFHDVLEQLKTNVHTNFRFKRVLGFVRVRLNF